MFAKKNAPKPLSRSLEQPKIASLPRLLPWAFIKVFLLATAAIFVAALAIAHKLTAAPIALWVPLAPAPAATELEIEYLEDPSESDPSRKQPSTSGTWQLAPSAAPSPATAPSK